MFITKYRKTPILHYYVHLKQQYPKTKTKQTHAMGQKLSFYLFRGTSLSSQSCVVGDGSGKGSNLYFVSFSSSDYYKRIVSIVDDQQSSSSSSPFFCLKKKKSYSNRLAQFFLPFLFPFKFDVFQIYESTGQVSLTTEAFNLTATFLKKICKYVRLYS